MPSYGSRTDVGLVREHNEDSLAVTPPLYAVADGMGGHAAGEVASEIAIQTLVANAPETADGDDLARAVVAANHAVIRAAAEGIGRKGMGTTMTAAMLSGKRLVVAQVGDSRAYLLHEGALQRITRDHSLMADLIESGQITVEEARVHPQRSVITRALGSDPSTLPDIYEMNVTPGDRLLLCSDGLSGMVDDSLLESTLERIKDPQRCAAALVNEAITAGGYDNITAVVVDVPSNAEAIIKKQTRKGRIGAILAVIAFVLVLIGVAAGSAAYLDHTAYLAEKDGTVAVYRGMPGEIAGLSFSQFDHDTGLAVDNLDGLPANVRERLANGIKVDSVEDADALVETWKTQVEEYEKDTAPAREKLTERADAEDDEAAHEKSADAPADDADTRDANETTEAGDAA
ncbi:MAG: Stp1/IreP family PP2C-type Ser/Thr phosphatase [Slackia sp.]|nr:Stp1/IreP family PP2C-type Ser/Thr phosphatase [Slackia sp.]